MCFVIDLTYTALRVAPHAMIASSGQQTIPHAISGQPATTPKQLKNIITYRPRVLFPEFFLVFLIRMNCIMYGAELFPYSSPHISNMQNRRQTVRQSGFLSTQILLYCNVIFFFFGIGPILFSTLLRKQTFQHFQVAITSPLSSINQSQWKFQSSISSPS